MVSGPAGICVNWSVNCAEFGTDLEQMFHGSPLQPMVFTESSVVKLIQLEVFLPTICT